MHRVQDIAKRHCRRTDLRQLSFDKRRRLAQRHPASGDWSRALTPSRTLRLNLFDREVEHL
jgi:hypothetical protein